MEKDKMKDKEKQIEEIKKIASDLSKCVIQDYGGVYFLESAEALFNAGYRKIPEGSVVLSAEEYSDYLTLQSNYANAKERCEKLQADNERLYRNIGKFKESVRKKTAKEILSDAEKELHKVAMEYANAGHKTYFAVCENIHHKVISPLAKQFGVEVEE